MEPATQPGAENCSVPTEADRRGLFQLLPPKFRTRRRFAFLLATVAFLGYGGWYWFQGQGLLSSVLAAVAAGAAAFLFFWWWFSRPGSGFDV